jgi:TPR repeat protein
MSSERNEGRGKVRSVRSRSHRVYTRLRGLLSSRTRVSPGRQIRQSYTPLPPVVVQIRRHRVTAEHLRNLLVRNPGYAVRWIEAAARSGLVPAQIVWGQLLLDGHGSIQRDARAAFASFESASSSGNAEALNMVGRCYEQGWGVQVDSQRATAHFEAAAETGHTWAQVNLAQMLMRAGNPADRARCFALFNAVAEGGTLKANLKAMNSLARFLEEGWAGAPDPAGAAFWYLKAANLGDHWAQFNLATILFRQGNQDAADRWLRSAVAISDNGFRRRIAPLLLARPERGLRERGLDALAHCARNGTPEDQYAYARALDAGVASPHDPAAAEMFFRSAVARGHRLAAEYQKRGLKAKWLLNLAAMVRTITRRSAVPHSMTQTTTHRNGVI